VLRRTSSEKIQVKHQEMSQLLGIEGKREDGGGGGGGGGWGGGGGGGGGEGREVDPNNQTKWFLGSRRRLSNLFGGPKRGREYTSGSRPVPGARIGGLKRHRGERAGGGGGVKTGPCLDSPREKGIRKQEKSA